ncbi:MAG TPA: hypothetical protein VF190_02250 [Rhodothermales bacterium]
MRRLVDGIALVLLVMAGHLVPDARAQAWVALETNEPDARVYADTTYLGQAFEGVFAVPSGEVRVILVAGEPGSWSIEPVEQAVLALPGDTTQVTLLLPHYYRIESIPYRAQVFVQGANGRELVGETPLTFTRPAPLEAPILVEKRGYVQTEIDPGADRWNRHLVMLTRAERAADGKSDAEVAWTPPRARTSRWIDYSAVGLAVASAIVSVHYKFKADALYEQYEETGDPLLERRIKRLDTRSGIALGAMQVGLGVFAIRLALR